MAAAVGLPVMGVSCRRGNGKDSLDVIFVAASQGGVCEARASDNRERKVASMSSIVL